MGVGKERRIKNRSMGQPEKVAPVTPTNYVEDIGPGPVDSRQ